MPSDQISYSEKYCDEKYEYRHVILPGDIAKLVPKTHLMTETEWRNLGVQQSPGWVHYLVHAPEPHHVLLFRRPLSTPPASTTTEVKAPVQQQPHVLLFRRPLSTPPPQLKAPAQQRIFVT